jgi:hypothetical protein
MTLRLENSVTEEQTSPQQFSDMSLSQANLLAVLKISQLQATIVQAKTKLIQLSRDTDTARKRVQAQAASKRGSGSSTHRYTQAEVEEVLRLVVLLEEENSQLRAISTLPVEIEKLKIELQTGTEPGLLQHLQAENANLKAQLKAALSRLRGQESSFNPNTSGTIELSLSIPRSARLHTSVLADISKPQIHKAVQSASPATKPVKPKPKRPARGSLPARNAKGYSPTFLRLSKSSKKTSSVPRLCEDLFSDCFPEEHEGAALDL